MTRSILYVLVFLACALVCARSRSPRVRQAVLLLGSYLVYLTWTKWFLAVLVASTVMNFLLGRLLRKQPSGPVLTLGIVLNLALLGSFKYLPDLAATLPSSLQGFAHLALPLGISFWTFQAMGYLFDLHYGEDLDPTFIEFALFMASFPTAISGPICRMPEMLPQFRANARTPTSSIIGGLGRIATGVLMMQLARLLGQGILSGDGLDSGFDHASHWTGLDVWLLAIGFGLQLFLNFAGYSHMAIGAAEALGFTVPENFSRPFQSTSVSVFWTRWHMSLSFWIRDYVFLPLAVLRREVWWRNLILVFSMVLFGLWHKASLLFVIWGGYHGLLLVSHRLLQVAQKRFDWTLPAALWNGVSWIATMAFVSLGWIFFRANSLGQAKQMVLALASPASYGTHFLSSSLFALVASVGLGYAIVLQLGLILGISEAEQDCHATQSGNLAAWFARSRWYWLPPLYVVALLLVLVVTHTRGADPAQFMYRNF